MTSNGKEQSNLSEFEERLSSIESKLDALNNLSPEKSFLEETSQSDSDQNGAINKENALAMMWKYMTIHRRVQATEEAVDKIMNILNDVMKDAAEMKKVKCHLDKLRDEQQKMAGEFDAVKRGEGLEFNSEKVANVLSVYFSLIFPNSQIAVDLTSEGFYSVQNPSKIARLRCSILRKSLLGNEQHFLRLY